MRVDVDGVDDVLPCFQTSSNLSLAAHLDVELLLLLLLLGLLGFGGPGTWASALMRAMCDHTAVISRNATKHIRKSMNGISVISWFDGASCHRARHRRQYQPWLLLDVEQIDGQPSQQRPRARVEWTRPPSSGARRRSGCVLETLEVDLLAVRDDQVQHLDATPR